MQSQGGLRFDTLKSFGLRAMGLKDALDADIEACEQLFDQARAVRDTVSLYQSPYDPQPLSDLSSVLDDILSYEKKLNDDSVVRKAISTRGHKELIESYNNRLIDARLRCQEITLIRQRTATIELHKLSSLRTPIDQIPPIIPPKLTNYVGHKEKLRGIVALLRSEPSSNVLIVGGGGMGKSAMATEAMHDPHVKAKFANRRFFINCDGVSSAEGVVAAVASVFNVTQSVPGATMSQALLGYFDSLHTSILLVLDNLESAWDTDDQGAVETFLGHLCNMGILYVIVTMRGNSPPHGPKWHQKITVQPLTLRDARTLFTQLYPESAGRAYERSLHELLILLDGMPLTLTLIASVGVTGYTPSDLLDAYRAERTAMVKRGRGKDRLSNLSISIRVSMHCQTMTENPEALKLLDLLSLLPDGLHEKDRTAVFPSMTGYPSAARVLVQVALCTRDNGLCRVLAPIRAYVQEHHPPREHGRHLQELRRFHMQLALRGWDWSEQPLAVCNEIIPKMGNIQAVLRHAIGTTAEGTEVLSALLALSHFAYITASGDCQPSLQSAIFTYQNFAEDRKEIKSLLAKCKMSLSDILQRQYNYQGAKAALQEAKAAFEDIGSRRGAAQCTQSLGGIMQMQYDYEGATVALEDARMTFEDIGEPHGAAQCTRTLSDIMRMQGDNVLAKALLIEAKTAFNDVGDRLGVAQCTRGLGQITQLQRDWDGATVAMKEAKALFEKIGTRHGAAQCTQSLGEILQMRHDYDGATAALNEAKAEFEHVGSLRGAAQCTQSLGEISMMRNDYTAAMAALNEAKTVFEDIGSRRGAAQCIQCIGKILQIQRDFESAAEALEQARAIFGDIGDLSGGAYCTMRLGSILQIQQDHEGARAAFNDAKTTFKILGNTHRTTQCTQKLANLKPTTRNWPYLLPGDMTERKRRPTHWTVATSFKAGTAKSATVANHRRPSYQDGVSRV